MKHKILIVEDDESLREMYLFKLVLENYSVDTAINGIDGYEKAKLLLPDLILLDIKMPLMNGDEMLQKVRSQSWGSTIKVIILTNLSRREAPMNLNLLNVSRYVVKAHTTPSQIITTMREVLGGKQKK